MGDKPYKGTASGGGYRTATRPSEQAWQGDVAKRRIRAGRTKSGDRPYQGAMGGYPKCIQPQAKHGQENHRYLQEFPEWEPTELENFRATSGVPEQVKVEEVLVDEAGTIMDKLLQYGLLSKDCGQVAFREISRLSDRNPAVVALAAKCGTIMVRLWQSVHLSKG